jgi:hypothetical protein
MVRALGSHCSSKLVQPRPVSIDVDAFSPRKLATGGGITNRCPSGE